MLRLLTALSALCVCAFAQESVLAVYLSQPEKVPLTVLVSIRSEAERVLEPTGRRLVWRDANSPGDDTDSLVVVRFSGSCSFSDYKPVWPGASSTTTKGEPLASTAVSDGKVLPFVELHCSRVRRVIAPLAIGTKSADREVALGKAVARVLAHEVYHVLSGAKHHSESGVAAECVGARNLTAPQFDLDSASISQMRQVRPAPVVSDWFEADESSSGR